MRIDMRHLAVKRTVPQKTSFADALRGFFKPVDSGLEAYLGKIGGLLQVEYNYKGGFLGSSSSGPTGAQPGAFSVNVVELNFATIAAARTAAGQAALASADVLNLFGVENGIWVPMTAMQVTTAEGATATCGIGDGTTPAGFQSASDLNATGWTSSLITTTYSLATAGGKIYAATDTIDMTLNHNSIDTAVARVIAVMVDLRA